MSIFKSIPAFVSTLKNRPDRKEHIIKEFAGRDEFKATLVEACEYKNGAIGLWNSIKHVLGSLVYEDGNFIILCEDDHQFTDYYSKEYLFASIQEAEKKGADVLSSAVADTFKPIVSQNTSFCFYRFLQLCNVL